MQTETQNLIVMIWKQTEDKDLKKGMTVAYCDTAGQYTKIGTIDVITYDSNLIAEYTVNGANYLCSELKLIEDLNDWSRFNKGLPEGQRVEISEDIYYNLLECLPPRNWKGNYFEVGEPHHHDNNGKAIHRACWIEEGKYYTGYPKNL